METRGFNLFSSNRLEHLVDALSRILKKPLSDPFKTETMVVQSRGMARWLSLEMARRNGVSALMDYPYPNVFVERHFGRFGAAPAGQGVSSVWDPDILPFKVFSLLPAFLETHDFPELSGYIGSGNGPLKRYQLAIRIGDLFDQYLLFRPDMIKAWEKGAGDDWQAHLWRMIRNETPDGHKLDLFSAFLEKAEKGEVPPGLFPERIFIFGISALPAFYLDVFQAVSRFSDVHLFLLNPCAEYWGDVLSERERFRAMKRVQNQNQDRAGLYLSQGNRLLASMGKTGRDFFDLVQTRSVEDMALFQKPGGDTLLSRIQDDIYQLRDPADTDYVKRTVASDDLSVQLHCCHSPLREVEVLQDRLYAMFDANSDLKPRDVLVMMTDCEACAPLIHSVFGKKPEGRDIIPYSVADRGFGGESRIARVFLALLDMKDSRFTVPEVMGFLEEEAVRQAFGLREDDLDVLASWVGEANIRWGWDGRHRKKAGLPEFEDCSWMAGLKRLLLGYALPGQDLHLFGGILPCDGIEGKHSEILGFFMDYAETLYAWASGLAELKDVSGWVACLLEGLSLFFKPRDRDEGDIEVIREEIRHMGEVMVSAGVSEPLDYSVIRYHLLKNLENREQGLGFISGGVTFCAMLPMRSIPFRVIAILGMNSGSYPRQGQACGFDLMAKNPRPGDRSLRADDRYLFLEALISARDTLYISYTGRSERDNTLIQPSVLVSELLDYIEAGFDCGEKTAAERLTLEHPLQPFSSRYFEHAHNEPGSKDLGLRLFSFSRDNYRAAMAGLDSSGTTVPFFEKGLAFPSSENLEVNVEDFCRFFRHPARYLLEKRLGMVIEKGAESVAETEPFEINSLDRYIFVSRLVDNILEGADSQELYAWARATGSLPLGKKGDLMFEDLKDDADAFAREILSRTDSVEKTPVSVDVRLDGLRISGPVGDLIQGRLLRFRPSGIKGKDYLELWIRHVLLAAAKIPGFDGSTLLGMAKGKGETLQGYVFKKPLDCQGILDSLAHLYLDGLTRPLPFFSQSSLVFCETLQNGKPMDEALKLAMKNFEGDGSDWRKGEREDVFTELAFRATDPVDETFVRCSREIYDPLLGHRQSLAVGGES